jgi:hypothetical protein
MTLRQLIEAAQETPISRPSFSLGSMSAKCHKRTFRHLGPCHRGKLGLLLPSVNSAQAMRALDLHQTVTTPSNYFHICMASITAEMDAIMREELFSLALGILLGASLASAASAQQTTGVPGSPDATTEAEVKLALRHVRFVPEADIAQLHYRYVALMGLRADTLRRDHGAHTIYKSAQPHLSTACRC